MGQYYVIANVDKKEIMDPFDFGSGMKLLEWSYKKDSIVLALMNLLNDRWNGDRVYVIGDYADDDDPEEACYDTISCLKKEIGCESLYDWACENCLRIIPDPKTTEPNKFNIPVKDTAKVVEGFYADTNDYNLRYIINTETNEFIDLDKCPIEWGWYDLKANEGGVASISPLPLLIAMGNGRGGGDYYTQNSSLVGSWCSTSKEILPLAILPSNIASYNEIFPDFTENVPPIPYTDAERIIAEERAKETGQFFRVHQGSF